MKKVMTIFLILSASAAGICFADDGNTGNAPNPSVAGQNGPNTMDNGDKSTNASNNY